jgi:hypothetical protein
LPTRLKVSARAGFFAGRAADVGAMIQSR